MVYIKRFFVWEWDWINSAVRPAFVGFCMSIGLWLANIGVLLLDNPGYILLGIGALGFMLLAMIDIQVCVITAFLVILGCVVIGD